MIIIHYLCSYNRKGGWVWTNTEHQHQHKYKKQRQTQRPKTKNKDQIDIYKTYYVSNVLTYRWRRSRRGLGICLGLTFESNWLFVFLFCVRGLDKLYRLDEDKVVDGKEVERSIFDWQALIASATWGGGKRGTKFDVFFSGINVCWISASVGGRQSFSERDDEEAGEGGDIDLEEDVNSLEYNHV